MANRNMIKIQISMES